MTYVSSNPCICNRCVCVCVRERAIGASDLNYILLIREVENAILNKKVSN